MPLPIDCDICGFLYDDVTPDNVAPRLSAATHALATILADCGEFARVRPSEHRWSILEYSAHMRDVLISIRERIVRATIEDHTIGLAMNRDERVNRGFYDVDTVEDLVVELDVLTRLLLKSYSLLTRAELDRPLVFSNLAPYEVTILLAAAQAVHEGEHHLADVRENLALLS
jgi:DinB superfamily